MPLDMYNVIETIALTRNSSIQTLTYYHASRIIRFQQRDTYLHLSPTICNVLLV
ncbi:hypothetical protein BJX76DRAFT_319506 [Aspergillus varians]